MCKEKLMADLGVMVVRNGLSYPSSNPEYGCLHFILH